MIKLTNYPNYHHKPKRLLHKTQTPTCHVKVVLTFSFSLTYNSFLKHNTQF